MPILGTITCFGFLSMRIDGDSVVYFRFTHILGRPRYVGGCLSVFGYWKTRSYGDCMCNCFFSVSVFYVGWWWREESCNPVLAYSLLLSKSTKETARLNVLVRRMNYYQQYNMPSQHMYCGRVWNLIQACDVQYSDKQCTSPPLLAPRLKIFK